jgi:hypothetical protein
MKKKISQNWIDQVAKKSKDYLGKYIVHDGENVYYASTTLTDANIWMRQHRAENPDLVCLLLSKNFFFKRILSVRVKSLKNDLWIPQKNIQIFRLDDTPFETEILVDSGADTTFIPYKLGLEIGWQQNKGDLIREASGVGSKVPYMDKSLQIQIDGHLLTVPVCWCLEPLIDDLLLGREGIFSKFKVIFDEKQEDVIFQPYEAV